MRPERQAPCEFEWRANLAALTSPAVSIVVCNHNHGRFLLEAIGSALAQDVPCQIVVVDDGSTDESRVLLSGLGERVEVVLQPNGGQLAAYESGLARCSGDVVVFLDADDALLPDAARCLQGLFAAGVAKVHFRMALVDAAGRSTGTSVPSSLAAGDVLGPLRRHGLLYPSAPGSGNAYRRDVLACLRPFPIDPSDRIGADFFTIYGAVAFGGVAACDRVLARYRIHRDPLVSDEPLVFGNAAIGNDESAKVARRYARLRAWLKERTNGAVALPATFLDFSVQKSVYAGRVLATPRRGAWHHAGSLRQLLKALWLQPAYPLARRLGLTAWAVLVLLTPRTTAFRLARHVCNPASRAP